MKWSAFVQLTFVVDPTFNRKNVFDIIFWVIEGITLTFFNCLFLCGKLPRNLIK